MRWVRANLWIGSRLALFALALQFVLSFSHVHLDGFNQGTQQVAAVQAGGEGGGASNEQPSAPGHDDLCPICLLIHLAGATLQPVPPALVLPEPVAWTPTVATVAIAAAFHHSSFNPRAPPAV
jgi:hypothetical protein